MITGVEYVFTACMFIVVFYLLCWAFGAAITQNRNPTQSIRASADRLRVKNAELAKTHATAEFTRTMQQNARQRYHEACEREMAKARRDTLRQQEKVAARESERILRRTRVENTIAVTCPVCSAKPGTTCTSVNNMEMVLLDRGSSIRAHMLRIEKAVMSGYADKAETRAQFGDAVPGPLTGVFA